MTTRSGAAVQAPQPCQGSFTARLPAQDGVYVLSVTATDERGRTSAPATAGYDLDTSAPAAPEITAQPAETTNADAPAWHFTAPGGTTECQLDYTAGAVSTTVASSTTVAGPAGCVSPYTAHLGGHPDGDYTFSVEVVDDAGNHSAAATSIVRRDTTPPRVPDFVTTPPAVASSRAPSWSFSVDADATAQCQVTGVTPPTGFVACASPYPVDLTGAADGSYTLGVRAVDAAGNVSATATSTTTLDTTAPTAVITSAPGSPLSAASLSWGFTAGDPGATLTCTLSVAGDAVAGDAVAGDAGPGASGLVPIAGPASCAGTVSYDVTHRPDGTYQLAVQATDAAGNVGPVTTSQVVLDRSPPAPPLLTGQAATTRDPQIGWSVTADPTAVIFCSLTGPDATSPAVPCGSPTSYDLSRRPDGRYTLSAYAEDQAGNRSATATSTVTLVRSAPGLGITGSPASPSQGRRPTWSFASDPGAGGATDAAAGGASDPGAGGATGSGTGSECRLDLGNTNVFPYGPCTSPFTADLTGDPDGAYTFSVRSHDAAGNVAGPVQSTYVLDTTPPASPVIASSPQSPGDSRSPVWTFSSEAGSLQTCRLLQGSADAGGNGVAASNWQPCAGSFVAALGATPDGLLTFQVRATDPAGNVSVPADSTYLLDSVAATPRITSAPPSPGRATAVSWRFSATADEAVACRLVRGATVLRPYAACASPVVEDLTGLGDGEIDLQVQARDAAGNTSGVAVSGYVLDTTAPAAPFFTAAPATPGSTRSPSWRFSGPGDGLTSCRSVQDTVALTSWLPCAGAAAADLTGLVDGSYALQVRATDAAGNVSAVVTGAAYLLITKPPVAPTIVVAPGPGGPAQAVSWQVSTPSGDRSQCRLAEGAAVVSDWAPCAGLVTYPVTGLTDGTLLFSTRAVDAVGAIGPSAASAFVLDRTPPRGPIISDRQGRSGVSGVLRWTFTADAGAATTCEVTRHGGEVVVPATPCTGSYAIDLSGRGSGSYDFLVRASDTWGNVGPSSVSTYTYDAPVLPPQSQVVTPGAPGVGPGQRPVFAPITLVLPAAAAPPTVVPAGRPNGSVAGLTPYRARPPPAAVTRRHPPAAAGLRPLPHPPLSVPRVFRALVTGAGHRVALPLALIVLLLLFLAVQDRLDRGDPKLARDPGAARDDYAEFR